MKRILNLTQHPASAEQVRDGVYDLEGGDRAILSDLLTFTSMPTSEEIENRCNGIYDLVLNVLKADRVLTESFFDDSGLVDEPRVRTLGLQFMIGGAPYLMGPLSEELSHLGEVVFAYSERVSSEKTIDGKVVKVNEFKHLGFIPAVLA